VLHLDRIRLERRGRLCAEQVSLQVEGGGLAVVEGARGAGKSTLAEVTACRARPAAGALWIAGRDVLSLQAASLPYVRRNIGYLPERPPLLLDESVFENVLLPLAARGVPLGEAQDLTAALLTRFGLPARTRTGALSAGERRLCAIARALIGAPAIVVLDEPTAGLDDADRGLVLDVVASARAAGAAVLGFSADAAFVAAAQDRGARRMLLHDGRLHGTTAHLGLVDATREADAGEVPARGLGEARTAPRDDGDGDARIDVPGRDAAGS
jgi:ABC-type ATPase involved in cell division